MQPLPCPGRPSRPLPRSSRPLASLPHPRPPPPTCRRLVKAGLLPDALAPRLAKVSAWGELVGYMGSLSLSLLRISLLLEREVALLAELQRLQQVGGRLVGVAPQFGEVGGDEVEFFSPPPPPPLPGGHWTGWESLPGTLPHSQLGSGDDSSGGGSAKALASEIQLLRARRVLRTLGLVQDLAGGWAGRRAGGQQQRWGARARYPRGPRSIRLRAAGPHPRPSTHPPPPATKTC